MSKFRGPIDTVFLGTVALMSSWTWNDARRAYIQTRTCDVYEACDEEERVRRRLKMHYLLRVAVYSSLIAFTVVSVTPRIMRGLRLEGAQTSRLEAHAVRGAV